MFGFAKHGCGATGVYIEFQRDDNEIITIKYIYRQTEIENQTICETKLGLFNPAISKLYIYSKLCKDRNIFIHETRTSQLNQHGTFNLVFYMYETSKIQFPHKKSQKKKMIMERVVHVYRG